MNKLVVYTCVTAGYDTVSKPQSFPDWADWVCYGPEKEISWTGRNSTQISRYAKLNPHILFPEYDYSLWIDGNIDVVSDEFWDAVKEKMVMGVLYSGIQHPQRDDVYDESLRILKNDRERMWRLMRIVRFLRSENFPRHWGLSETNMILRKHLDKQVDLFDSLWWKMLSEYTDRDQMSWSYCMWKTGLEMDVLLGEGLSSRNCPWIKYTVHDKPYRKNAIMDAVRAIKVRIFGLWLGL